MRDVAYVAITAGFFGLCAAYVSACARIVGSDPVVEPAEQVDGPDEVAAAQAVPVTDEVRS